MMNRVIRIVVVGLLVFTATLTAQAQSGEKQLQSLLEQRDRQIKGIIGTNKTFTEQQKAKLKDLINGVIDFEAMGKASLGPQWDKLTPAQQKDFVDVFSEIVRTQSLADLEIYRTKVTYGKITVKGPSATVMTSITYKNIPAKVVYLLGFRNNQWRVDDIIIDDVSTAEGYARSFQSVIRKKGFDSLMASLRKKLGRVASTT